MKRREATTLISVAAMAVVIFSALSSTVCAQDKPENNQQDSTLTIGTTLITVPVIVTDRYGRFITGLGRSDFSVREDGVVQKIERFSSTEAPFNVALLIDTSRSTQNKLAAIRKAALAFIKQLQPSDRVMIVTFDEQVRFISDFTNNTAELQRAIKSVKSSYLTSLYDAISLTITQKMEKIQGRKAIVILSDGVDTASRQATYQSALNLVASSGIISYAIQYETRNDGGSLKGVILPNSQGSSLMPRFSSGAFGWMAQEPQSRTGSDRGQKEESRPIINIPRPTISVREPEKSSQPDATGSGSSAPSVGVRPQAAQPVRDRYLVAADFLRSLAAQTGARYIRAENIENTSFAFQLIAVELRNQYTLTYISTNEQRDGTYRSIAVTVNQGEPVVRARLGYRALKPGSDSKPDGEK
ncbi:MAG TPA: VWA domain-containing protein [Blastocatellia bacterium]|nr:VWA domain-containing protein [Blastocatellia bacterium]